MKRIAILFAFVLCALPAMAAEDFSGKWSGSFTGLDPSGQQMTEQIFMNLVHKGATLSGTAGPSAEQQWKIQNGKVDGVKVSFEVQGGGDTQGGPLLKFAMSYAEGHLKGDVNAEMGEKKLTAKIDTTRVK
jgi:hypothetical protein